MATDETPVLWHITFSNFNEKARWAVDYKRLPHRRVTPPPGAHMAVALALTRRTATLPVLRIGGRTIGDSTRIIEALEQHVPDPPLYPSDPDARRRALELEDFFDENLGPDVRRVGLADVLRNPAFLRPRGDALPARAIGATAPALRAMLRRRYGITDRSTALSRIKVRAVMCLIEDLLDGGDHLVGDRFSVADLTAAGLLGPLLAPPQLPYRNPKRPVPRSLEPLSAELRALPAGQWVLRMYERHRPPSAEIDSGDRTAAEPPRPGERQGSGIGVGAG